MQEITTEIQSLTNPYISDVEINNEEIKVKQWTRDEYYKMAELGFFHGKRVELIEGEIIEMSAMKSPQATAVSLVYEILREIFNSKYFIRNQQPISFSKITEPEPDLAVVKGKIRDFADSHPKNAKLIVEISDATLYFDRGTKSNLYAKNKIKDYWILNLKDRRLEVYRRPIKDKRSKYIYSEIQIFTENDEVSPLAMPKAKIKVADLLP